MISALLLAAASVPAVRAHADLGSYFHVDDYPEAAALHGEWGTVGFTLDVDARGQVAACRVTQSSGSQALDEATCQILSERAQFTPARDRTGAAIPDHVSDRVAWALPPPPPESHTSLASYISPYDYPAEAIRRGEEGDVRFEIRVSPQGRAAASPSRAAAACWMPRPAGS